MPATGAFRPVARALRPVARGLRALGRAIRPLRRAWRCIGGITSRFVCLGLGPRRARACDADAFGIRAIDLGSVGRRPLDSSGIRRLRCAVAARLRRRRRVGFAVIIGWTCRGLDARTLRRRCLWRPRAGRRPVCGSVRRAWLRCAMRIVVGPAGVLRIRSLVMIDQAASASRRRAHDIGGIRPAAGSTAGCDTVGQIRALPRSVALPRRFHVYGEDSIYIEGALPTLPARRRRATPRPAEDHRQTA